jgi:CheY-like chemotaxis protein
VLGGPETARAMKADPALAVIPIVMMTSLPESLPDDSPPLFDAFLLKPFTPDQLFGVVAGLLPRA